MRKRTLRISTAQHVLGSLSRTLLALTFLFSGFVKAVDPLGTVYKIEDYFQLGFGQFLQWAIPMAGTAAVLLICMEMLLGVCMLLNVRTRVTSVITLLFYLVMTPLTLYIAIANPVSDCGCFGDALVITNWQTFWKNIILLCFAITLMICRKSIPQLWNGWAEICIALIGIGAAAGIMGYSYTHLPIIDFRPYKIGVNIPELITPPSPDTTVVTLVYEKEGKRQVFTLENYPKGDPEWTFVDQISTQYLFAYDITSNGIERRLVPVSYQTSDFNIDEDILFTSEILDSETPVTFIMMYDLNKADYSQAARAVQLYNKTIAKGEDCYFLTGSDYMTIETFAEKMGVEPEDFHFMDDLTIKTIIRANPGVVVLENGTIVSKQNMRQL